MSTATQTRTERATHETVNAPRTSVARVVRAEWIKQRSLRSTWITLSLLLAAIVGFGLLAAWVTGHLPEGARNDPSLAGTPEVTVSVVLAGAQFAVILVAVLGVLVGAREFTSGLIRTTLAAVPRRWPVLLGKVAVFTALVLPVVLGGILVAFVGGTALLSWENVAHASLTDPGVLRALLGTAAYLVGIGVMGVALGMLLRGVGAGIGVLVGGLVFVPSLLLVLLPPSWGSVLKYLPSNAGTAMSGTVDEPTLLAFGAGAAVFIAWIVASLAAATVALMRRDA